MLKIKNYLLESPDVKIVLVAALYFCSAYLGLLLAFKDPITSPVWPPVGVGLALLLILGPRAWPGITIGSLLAYMVVFWQNGININLFSIQASLLISTGNTLEILAGQFLIRRFVNDSDIFRKTNDTFLFLISALFMCIIGAAVGTYSLTIVGFVNPSNFVEKWFFWWIPNVASVLLFTPFILSWQRGFKIKISQSKAIEIGIFIMYLLAFMAVWRFTNLTSTIEKSFPFIVIPFLLWLAFRFNLPTTISGVLIMALTSIYFTIYGLGPFVLDTNESSIILLQIFIGVISITSIVVSSTVNERSEAQRYIKAFNETLEGKIKDRTKELNDEIIFRKKTEETLKTTNRQLRKANVELDNFVYKVSHDLRAPIASVLGLVNLAKKEINSPETTRYFEMIGKSAQQQDLFIRDILDISRNARLVIDKEKIQWRKLIDDTFESLKYGSVPDKEITKAIKIKGKTAFFSDNRRLKVIFNNLLSNALRYSNGKDPVITIDIQVNNKTAAISIADNGLGIDKKHHKRIFDMFYRATDTNAGSGLGLYIVKESVDKLNGSISLESDIGRGSCFTMTIPNMSEN